MMKQILLIAFASFILQNGISQVGIGTLTPDNSAVLELSATDKGFLVPRVSQTDMGLIPAPADGLVVYNTTEGRLFFFNMFFGWGPIEGFGTDPDRIVDAVDSDTKVIAVDTGAFDYVLFEIEGEEKVKWLNNANDQIRQQIESQHVFIGNNAGGANSTGNFNTFVGGQSGETNTTGGANTFLGNFAGRFNSEGSQNTFIGEDAGAGNLLGNGNTAVGEDALNFNTTGHGNVAIGRDALTSNDNLSYLVAVGDSALFNNKSGSESFHGTNNTAIGSKALFNNTDGNWNTALGYHSLFKNSTGYDNVGIGLQALGLNTTGIENVALGTNAGSDLLTGSKNVFIGNSSGSAGATSGNIMIGYKAGQNATGNNRLYIDNSETETPLIYGDFDQNFVRLYNRLGIGIDVPQSPIHVKTTENISGIYSEVVLVNPYDAIAVEGKALTGNGYGLGGQFEGGYIGVRAIANTPTTGGFPIFGLQSTATLSDDQAGETRAVYGSASGALLNWAGYFEQGNVHVQNDLRIGTLIGKSGYALTVDGKIVSEELKIEDSGAWPDYVFADDYDLMSLEEIEQSIEENKHLPGIPSAAEVEENGILVGDMQRRMMEKIEELTLHVISLQKRIKDLEKTK